MQIADGERRGKYREKLPRRSLAASERGALKCSDGPDRVFINQQSVIGTFTGVPGLGQFGDPFSPFTRFANVFLPPRQTVIVIMRPAAADWRFSGEKAKADRSPSEVCCLRRIVHHERVFL